MPSCSSSCSYLVVQHQHLYSVHNIQELSTAVILFLCIPSKVWMFEDVDSISANMVEKPEFCEFPRTFLPSSSAIAFTIITSLPSPYVFLHHLPEYVCMLTQNRRVIDLLVSVLVRWSLRFRNCCLRADVVDVTAMRSSAINVLLL